MKPGSRYMPLMPMLFRDVATFLATPSSANLKTAVTDETGSGALVFATSPTLVTPILGTPASGVLTNCTGTASGLTAGNVTTNANLTGPITSVGNATAVASQTGTGSKFVMDTSPTLVTPVLGTPGSGTLTNCTGLPVDAGTTGTLPVSRGGTGVTASTGSGSVVLNTSPTLVAPALGTPASGVLTNCTGLPIVAGTTGTISIARGGTGATSLDDGYIPKSSSGTSYSASQIRDDGTSVAIGAAPSTASKMQILDALSANGSQLRLTHTASVDYCDFIVDGNGVLTIAPTLGITQLYDGTNSQSLFIYDGATLDIVLSTGGNDSYIKTGPFAIGTDTPNEKLTVAGAIAIIDGMAEPSTTSGYAKIYVDSADGDLKIKFGDGTVKTIMTDT